MSVPLYTITYYFYQFSSTYMFICYLLLSFCAVFFFSFFIQLLHLLTDYLNRLQCGSPCAATPTRYLSLSSCFHAPMGFIYRYILWNLEPSADANSILFPILKSYIQSIKYKYLSITFSSVHIAHIR